MFTNSKVNKAVTVAAIPQRKPYENRSTSLAKTDKLIPKCGDARDPEQPNSSCERRIVARFTLPSPEPPTKLQLPRLFRTMMESGMDPWARAEEALKKPAYCSQLIFNKVTKTQRKPNCWLLKKQVSL